MTKSIFDILKSHSYKIPHMITKILLTLSNISVSILFKKKKKPNLMVVDGTATQDPS
jgi:hypothetical protein